jgi:hypothetical protein
MKNKTVSFRDFLESKEAFECFVLNSVSQSKEPRAKAMRSVLTHISNMDYSNGALPTRESVMAVSNAFDWSATPEKESFWKKVSNGWASYLNAHFPDIGSRNDTVRTFLASNNALDQFIKNCRDQEQPEGFLEANENDPRCISNAFTWAITPEEHLFWASLHERFFQIASKQVALDPSRCSIKEERPKIKEEPSLKGGGISMDTAAPQREPF